MIRISYHTYSAPVTRLACRRGITLVLALLVRLLAASLCAADGGSFFGPKPKPEEVDEVHVLDPIEVSSYADDLPWVYAESNGTEVLSLCSDAATRAFISILRGRNALLNDTLPAYLRGELAAPAYVILYDSEDTEVTRRGMLRRQYVLPETGAELSRRKPPDTPQTIWAQDRDIAALSANLRFGPPHDETLSRRWPYSVTTALRFLLERQYPQLPPWLVEGLEGHLRECTWLDRDNAFELQVLSWVSPNSTRALLKGSKEPVKLLPLATLFADGPGDHPRGADDTYSTYEAEAALFVRWALEFNFREHREAFWRFAMRAADEPVTEDLFREHFGMSFAAAEDRLRAYVPLALRNEITISLPRRWNASRIVFHDATENEIGRIKAEWDRLQARLFAEQKDPGSSKESLDRARRVARRGFEQGRSDPRMVGLRGLIEVDAGDPEAARPFLEEAARGGVARPGVYLELARLRLRNALENPGAPFGTISAGQLNGILEALATARTQVPLMSDVYVLMAEACAKSSALADPQYLAMLSEGARLFPRNSELVCRVAELHAANGFRRDAADMVLHSLSLAPDAAERERLESLRTSLDSTMQFRLRTSSQTALRE